MFRTTDASTVTVTADLLDDNDKPLMPASGYPKVALLDKDKTVIGEYGAAPSPTPGTWESTIILPELGVRQTQELRVRWRIKTTDGDKQQVFDTLLVDPKAERRDSDIVVLYGSDTADFVVPYRAAATTKSNYQIFSGNNEVLIAPVDFIDASVEVDMGVDRSVVSIPVPKIDPSLNSNLLVVKCKINNRPKMFSYRCWIITPQIAKAMTVIEDFLNKARIENVIPELEYTDGDIIGYLERGLYMFNMQSITTAFNGLNMQGALFEAWIICASYWALGSQLIAEGSLAFDFSGQGISLNVDRTPQLDSALGRIEARIQDTVIPLKKQITQQGFRGGSGDIGNTAMLNPYAMGTLGMINAPTTRVNGFTNFIGRRF